MNKAKKRNKLGRPKKLTPAELRRGVEAYFASISYMEPVTREEFVVLNTDPKTGAVEFLLDKMGHRAVRNVPVLGADGKPLMRLVYTQAPGDFGLCDYLHISPDTWARYGNQKPEEPGYDPDYAEIYARARGRICAYLEGASEEKGGRGAQFKLERMYGLTNEAKVVVAGGLEAWLREIGEDGVKY